jgi:gluconolactonase
MMGFFSMRRSLFSFLFLFSSSLFAVESADTSLQLPLEVYSEEFGKILGKEPRLHLLCTGFGFTEGPVYFSVKGEKKGYLIFTDQTHDTIHAIRWEGLEPFNQITSLSYSSPAVFRNPSNIADGQTADLEGRLLTCETTGRRVSRTDGDGTVTTLAGFYDGKPFNSPNDVVVKSDGSVWFTDPSYGCLQFPQECYLGNNVYRLDPETGEVTVVTSALKMPNGIAFSPDEKILYIVDSAAAEAPQTYYANKPHEICAFDVSSDGKKLSNKRTFAEVSPGFPDGMRLDANGNIYVGALDGVHVLSPEGKLLGKILLPKETANLTFGGEENNILFICSSNSIWAIKLNAKGCKPVPSLALPMELSTTPDH